MCVVTRSGGNFRAALVGAVLASAPFCGAQALTAYETDAIGAEFSGAWNAPTVIGAGYDKVSGTGAGNAYDIFHFTSLASGAQDVVMSFTAPEGIDYSYSAGGDILWDTQAFDWAWDGVRISPAVQVDYYTRSMTLTLNLPKTFSGDLWLGLYFTHGQGLAYSLLTQVAEVAKPSLSGKGGGFEAGPIVTDDASISAFAAPLPPALALFGAALAGLGLASRRRGAAA